MSDRIIKTLENGLKVVYETFPSVDSLNFILRGRVGAMWEEQNELGIAHYIEHLAFDGSKKYPDPDKFRGVVEDNGGKINAYTTFLEATYSVKIIKQEMEKAFDFLSQQATEPTFKEDDIEKQRTVITQEYNTSRDDPVTNFLLNSQKAVFAGGSRLQHPLIGIDNTLKTIDRKQILKFFNKNYKANNFVLSICGDVDESKILELAENYFSSMPAGEKNHYSTNHQDDNQIVYTENNKDVKQATISIMFRGPLFYSPEYYPATYLREIFGDSIMSRLFREVRQKRGLAYFVSSPFNSEVSYSVFELVAQVEPVNVTKVIKLMKKEIDKIIENGITDEEYDRTKKALASNFIFNYEKPGTRASINAKSVLEDHEEETYEVNLKKCMSVRKEEVNNAAKTIFSKKPKFRVLSNKITDEQILNAWNS